MAIPLKVSIETVGNEIVVKFRVRKTNIELTMTREQFGQFAGKIRDAAQSLGVRPITTDGRRAN